MGSAYFILDVPECICSRTLCFSSELICLPWRGEKNCNPKDDNYRTIAVPA